MPQYTGQALVDWVLTFVGNLLLVGLAIGAFNYWAKSQWGALFGFIAGGVVAGAFVWFPDKTIKLLKALAEAFFSAGA